MRHFLASHSFATLRSFAGYMWRRAAEDRLHQVAGSLTFTTILALVPLFTVAFALLTAFPIFDNFRQALQGWMIDSLIPDHIAAQVIKYLNQFANKAKGLTAIGLGGLAMTSVLTLLTIENAFNAIWRVGSRRNVVQRLLVFWAAITISPLLFGSSLSISSWLVTQSARVVHAVPVTVELLIGFLSLCLSGLAFALLYSYLPNADVRKRDAAIGGVFAALAFEVAKSGMGLFVARFPTYTAVYGAFAALLIFLLWIYISWLITLVGAEIVAMLPVMRTGTWRHRPFPGDRLYAALGVLLLLYRARREQPLGLTAFDLAVRLRRDMVELHTLLDSLKSRKWIDSLDRDGQERRWVMICDSAWLTLGDVVRAFGVDSTRLPHTRLGRLLGTRSEAVADMLGMHGDAVSLDHLFANE